LFPKNRSSVAIATDNSGTQGTSDVVNVEFLLALPQGEFAGIADQDRFLTGTNVAFTLTASDPDSDVTSIQVFINDQLVCQTNGVAVTVLDCSFSTTTLGAGSAD
jgi:hypothetical protein